MPHIEGVEINKESLYGCTITMFHVQSEQAAEMLKKPIGSYITIETGSALNRHNKIENVGECLTEVLGRVLCPYYRGKFCVCGLGNRNAPTDTLGPEVIYNLPLKVLSETGMEGNFRDVVSFEPGTSWTNNIDTEVIINGIIKAVGADCILLIDSLVTEEPSKLFQTIQISTAGGTRPYLTGRKADWSSLDIPVLSLGIPMAIPLSVLLPHSNQDKELFTSVEIPSIIAAAGRIIAYAILRVCWPLLSKEECFVLSGINRDPVPSNFLLNGEAEEAEQIQKHTNADH